jgi:hypothetical protein
LKFLPNAESGYKNKRGSREGEGEMGERDTTCLNAGVEVAFRKAADYKAEQAAPAGKFRKRILPNHTLSFLDLMLTDRILL